MSYSACGLPFFIEGNFDDSNMLWLEVQKSLRRAAFHIHLLSKEDLTDKKQVVVLDMVKRRNNR